MQTFSTHDSLIPLPALKEGQSGTVVNFSPSCSMTQRLMELGFVSGARIECVQKCRHGDPIAYGVKGAVIALRNDDSRRILVMV